MAQSQIIDQAAVNQYHDRFEKIIAQASKHGQRTEALLAAVQNVQSELFGDHDVPFASGMELLLRAIIHLLEGHISPDYVSNKLMNGVGRISHQLKSPE